MGTCPGIDIHRSTCSGVTRSPGVHAHGRSGQGGFSSAQLGFRSVPLRGLRLGGYSQGSPSSGAQVLGAQRLTLGEEGSLLGARSQTQIASRVFVLAALCCLGRLPTIRGFSANS